MFAAKTSKGEAIDKTPYSVYYPHSKGVEERNWDNEFRQFISIDPARKNLGFRIERRHNGGEIETLAYNKFSVEEFIVDDEGRFTHNMTYSNITSMLDDHKEYFEDTHYIIIERQLPENYKATRIAQHIISYFSITLRNAKLLPMIIEVAPQLKGKMLKPK